MTWTGVLETPAATARCATLLAPLLRAGDVIALQGDLGAGKTAFARALIQALHAGEEVPSPTFNLVLTYEPADPGAPVIWHFDLYRLERPEDAYELGIEEAFDDAISLIEWPDRLGRLLPDHHLEIRLQMGRRETSRRIEIRVPDGDLARFRSALEAMGLEPVHAEAGDT
ncbi:MAG: tRNA (adenosine(37)-N6)-threonylcarbamoyltransferase complex ATPase subunit type 1 TsaE [Alphaproteobacteria bacterium]|nr:MAG: tRNA (adenosine(37)-N6)-threonylcarbamoyltransferase complex ATPase subunit type 1 TsaE [Alphaproteobacteria bacterium]